MLTHNTVSHMLSIGAYSSEGKEVGTKQLVVD